MPNGRRKFASKDSKPRQRRKMTETERENKKRKKEQLQQRTKANFLQLFSRAKVQGLEIESDK